MKLQEFYENRYSTKAQGAIWRSDKFRVAEHRRIERELIAELEPRPGFTLDLGSGRAQYLQDADDVVALDLSVEALRSSNRRLRVACTGSRLPFGDGCAALVVCCQTLEHVPDWRETLAEITRVTAPGGRLILTVPNRYALMSRRFHRVQRKIDESGHIHEFREAQLQFELIQLGWQIEKSQGACYDLFWLIASAERGGMRSELLRRVEGHVPQSLFDRAFALESRCRKHALTGLSLEIVASKTDEASA